MSLLVMSGRAVLDAGYLSRCHRKAGDLLVFRKEGAFQSLPRQPFGIGGKTTALSMLSSAGAVLAACSCCILPLVLASIGLSTGVSGLVAPLGPLRWPMVGLSGLMLVGSWMVVLRQSRACECQTTHMRTGLRTPKILMLTIATSLMFLAIAWDAFEPALMGAML